MGTAAGLVPVRSITRKLTQDIFTYIERGAGPGPCCVALTASLNNIMRGNAPDLYGWCLDAASSSLAESGTESETGGEEEFERPAKQINDVGVLFSLGGHHCH